LGTKSDKALTPNEQSNMHFIFSPLDFTLAMLLPASVPLSFWAVVCGAGSMLIYWRFSAQERLESLSKQAAEAQAALSAHEGSFEEAMPLLRSSLVFSLLRVKAALLPSLLAGLPMILFFLVAEPATTSDTVVFLVVSSLTAVAVKLAFRIK